MDIVMITVLCITAAVMCKLVENNGREFSAVISIAAATVVLIAIVSQISDISDTISGLFEKAQIPDEYPSVIFKSLGVCYITQLGSDCCKDCGESGLASCIETAGKISVLMLSMPLFKALAVIIETLLA